MSNTPRQQIERRIARSVVTSLLSNKLYSITVYNGDQNEITDSKDSKLILNAMFKTDEDILYVHRDREEGPFGWVRLVYGNDEGTDVLSDYTVNLEYYMAPATQLSEQLAGR